MDQHSLIAISTISNEIDKTRMANKTQLENLREEVLAPLHSTSIKALYGHDLIIAQKQVENDRRLKPKMVLGFQTLHNKQQQCHRSRSMGVWIYATLTLT